MTIDYISDLHLDSHCRVDNGTKIKKGFITVSDYYDRVFKGKQESDVLLVAGDMGHNIFQVKQLFDMLAYDYQNILYCLGNHEYWYGTGNVRYNNYQEKNFALNRALQNDRVKFMDGDVVTINGINIGGSSLWYDFSSGASRGINQGSFNRLCNEYFSDPSRMGLPNMDCKGWFDKEYKKAKNVIDQCDVYFSHVGPKEPDIIRPEFDNFVIGFFYFDGKELLSSERIKAWVFGHTHDNIKETWTKPTGEKVNLLCNPVGYHTEFDFLSKVESFEV